MASAFCMIRLISETMLRPRDHVCLETALGHLLRIRLSWTPYFWLVELAV
jgi:hypothetical protein